MEKEKILKVWNAFKNYFIIKKDLVHSKNILRWIWINNDLIYKYGLMNQIFFLETNPI